MKYAKYLAGAAALASCGFLLAVGLMSVLFQTKTGAFAPSTSADAASWVQAIGSIGAILGAFFVGAHQTKHARQLYEESRERERKDKEQAQLAVITLLRHFGARFENCITENMFYLRMHWEFDLKNNVRATLQAFDAMPLHELGSGSRVRAAARVRSAVQSMYDAISNNIDRLLALDDADSEDAFREIADEIEKQALEIDDAWISVTNEWPVRR